MLFEVTAINAVKPIVVAGVGTILLERSGFDLSRIPLVGGFLGDPIAEGDDDAELTARYFCCFGRRRKAGAVLGEYGKSRLAGKGLVDEDEAEGGASYAIPCIMGAMGAIDVIMGGVLLESMYLPIDQPLRLWLGGAIALGFPVSLLVSRVAKRCGFRQAFIVESMATIASGAWLSYGMMIVSKSTAFKTAPLLFWTVYIACVTSWSVIGTSMLGLVLTTVVAIAFGKKRPAVT
mmetsp:Transcript_19887/g.50147  ORF Transcript_19887/g.50147 Transcript_19887/m.50147 type:complete len:234 (+) Transcript_19887:663-1364(+)|eukprot:CAMPEP_0178990766 /NCGR_PEP_ID=MMETSP0795-20121207/5150_1 /TAXON_ID=88552 /ORGANISM="Amoebophrya sp., Strain Ameob2" /LENGTH=233 /DNA_ID=CAMNT_0020682391 /DNA_START=617 /DNA_END=1318 /DNA_ORIENTATION=-